MKFRGTLRPATATPTLCVFMKKNTVFWGSRFAYTNIFLLGNFKPYVLQFVHFRSASLNGKRVMYLTTDHSGLNKFHGLEDENFQLVLPELQRMVQACQMALESEPPCMFPFFFLHFLVSSAQYIFLQLLPRFPL